MVRAAFDEQPNEIVEVYGNFKNPRGAKCALVKTANGDAYFVLPSEVDGRMPEIGELLDTSKHEKRRVGGTTTPTVTEALAGAVEMLQRIANGGNYGAIEFHERLQSYDAALTDARMLEIQDARRREQIRNLGREVRGQG